MRRAAALLAGAAVFCVVAAAALHPGGAGTDATARAASASTATVERGKLSAAVAQDGILTYRARPDGSPFPVINRAGGTYTRLPDVGDRVRCGEALYRVDDDPVLLLCGSLPAYRTLRVGDAGRDVRQLNRALDVPGSAFTTRTEQALELLQRRTSQPVDGSLALGEAVVLPGAVRIAKVAGEPGGSARPGARVLDATSGTLHVQVELAPFEQDRVQRGARTRITLPGNRMITGRVAGFGRTARAPTGPERGATDATVPTSIRLDDPRAARGLDRAPVQVEIATAGVRDVLSVPVTALVGRSGGGFAVEVAGAGERRDLVAVDVGLFDTAAGRVEVRGALEAGDRVVVPTP